MQDKEAAASIKANSNNKVWNKKDAEAHVKSGLNTEFSDSCNILIFVKDFKHFPNADLQQLNKCPLFLP